MTDLARDNSREICLRAWGAETWKCGGILWRYCKAGDNGLIFPQERCIHIPKG